jgi:hypothetical protein
MKMRIKFTIFSSVPHSSYCKITVDDVVTSSFRGHFGNQLFYRDFFQTFALDDLCRAGEKLYPSIEGGGVRKKDEFKW